MKSKEMKMSLYEFGIFLNYHFNEFSFICTSMNFVSSIIQIYLSVDASWLVDGAFFFDLVNILLADFMADVPAAIESVTKSGRLTGLTIPDWPRVTTDCGVRGTEVN